MGYTTNLTTQRVWISHVVGSARWRGVISQHCRGGLTDTLITRPGL